MVVAEVVNPTAIEMGIMPIERRQTFCFLRLQLSHALAVRCLLSGSTLGRVMVGGDDVVVVLSLALTSLSV